MGWLDRDRAPVRFAVVTSVLSGLVLAGILKALRIGVTGGGTLIWFALVPGGIIVVVWAAVLSFRRVRGRSRRAFLVTSAFEQKYYVAAFVRRLDNSLDRYDVDLVIKVPDRDYDASAQARHLDRITRRRHDYIGGIIFASEVQKLRGDLAIFCRESRLPVVFTDLEPFEKESDYPPNSAFIGYDTGELGELAGRWLGRQLRRKRRPRVLIIASTEHGDRQRRCAEVLRAELPDALITIDDRCEFVRARAHEAVRAHIGQLGPRACLDAIFCTNDEMALGAVDALSTPSPATLDTLIIGIDGVTEAKALIDSASSPFRATVVQDAHRLAVSVVDLLVKMNDGRTVPKRTILNAEIYEAKSPRATTA